MSNLTSDAITLEQFNDKISRISNGLKNGYFRSKKFYDICPLTNKIFSVDGNMIIHAGGRMNTVVQYEDLTLDEAVELGKKRGIIIVPAGTTEGHGFHIPLATDTFNAEWIAAELSRRSFPRPSAAAARRHFITI